MSGFLVFCSLVLWIVVPVAPRQEPVRVGDLPLYATYLPWYEAENRVERAVTPVYPAIAVSARVQATMTAYVLVASDGGVSTVFLPGGMPLLAQATLDAVRQWRFQPMSVNGQPSSALAEVVVPFYLDDSPAVRGLVHEVYERARECADLLQTGRMGEAEPVCVAAGDTAARLPPERKWERALAHRLAADMQSARGQSSLALQAYKAAIDNRDQNVQDDSLASARLGMARVYAATGDIKNARGNYEAAEKALREFQKVVPDGRTDSARAVDVKRDLDAKCTRSLAVVLRELIDCLTKAGRSDEARSVQQRLERLARSGEGR